MTSLTRLFAPAALAAALAIASLAPAPVQAQSAGELTRSIVNIADVVFRNQQPYDRYGDYSQNDRLVAGRDQYGRPIYYRQADRRYSDPRYGRTDQRNGPPYGNAYGYYGNAPGQRAKCNKHGKCKASFYDARYDRNDRGHRDHDDRDHDGNNQGDGYADRSHHGHGDRDDD